VSARVRDSMQVEARGDFYRLTCRAMSTPVNIAFVAPSAAAAHELQQAAIDWIARFEARYSRFLPESIVGTDQRTSGGGGGGDWLELDEDADRLLSMCAEMHCLTPRVFDPRRCRCLRIWIGRRTHPHSR